MGRPSRSRSLGIWMNGVHVGEWRIPSAGPMELRYADSWLASPEARPLSLSLPLSFDGEPLRGDRVAYFFDNLLPDSEAIRQRVRARFRTATAEPFELLSAVGRDCVGAVQLLAEGVTPDPITTISVTSLTDAEVERSLRAAASDASPIAVDDDDLRISLAGVQEKTALTWHKNRWCRPHGPTPTTHIFKLPLGRVGGRQLDMRESLENEWLCARLLEQFGVPVAPSELRTFGSTRALVVTRFDRKLDVTKKFWLRLPQEDLCQATATPSSRKYEADGGPGLHRLCQILHGSEAREQDLATVFRAQVLFWMLAAIDGHAKNFSLRLLPEGRYRLTPLYDVMSAWPIVGRRHDQVHPKHLKLAMALHGKNRHYHVVEIERRHFTETARSCGFSGMDEVIESILERVGDAMARVEAMLPKDFPERLFITVRRELEKSAAILARGRV